MIESIVFYLFAGICLSFMAKDYGATKLMRILTILVWPLLFLIGTVYLTCQVIKDIIEEK